MEERRLSKARAEMERALGVFVKGVVAPDVLQPRIQALEVEIAETSAALATDDAHARAIGLHPALLNRYIDLIGTNVPINALLLGERVVAEEGIRRNHPYLRIEV